MGASECFTRLCGTSITETVILVGSVCPGSVVIPPNRRLGRNDAVGQHSHRRHSA